MKKDFVWQIWFISVVAFLPLQYMPSFPEWSDSLISCLSINTVSVSGAKQGDSCTRTTRAARGGGTYHCFFGFWSSFIHHWCFCACWWRAPCHVSQINQLLQWENKEAFHCLSLLSVLRRKFRNCVDSPWFFEGLKLSLYVILAFWKVVMILGECCVA